MYHPNSTSSRVRVPDSVSIESVILGSPGKGKIFKDQERKQDGIEF